jgi:hypothetical protein
MRFNENFRLLHSHYQSSERARNYCETVGAQLASWHQVGKQLKGPATVQAQKQISLSKSISKKFRIIRAIRILRTAPAVSSTSFRPNNYRRNRSQIAWSWIARLAQSKLRKSIKFVKKILKTRSFSEGREWIFGQINDLACINHKFKPMEA